MNVRNLLIFHAILAALTALTTLLAPTVFLETVGLEVSQTTTNQMRVYGAVISGFTVTSWLMRNVPASRTRQAYLLGTGMSSALLAVINVVNITAVSSLPTMIPWAIFGLNVVLAGAFLYFGYKELAN